MDRTTQKHSRGFAGTYGSDYGCLEMMDIIAHELSENDIKNARKVMSKTNSLFASIEYNSEERQFLIWAGEQARKQMLDMIEQLAWERAEAKSITRNFVVTRHKKLVKGKDFRPKGFGGDKWHLYNFKRKDDED